MKNIGILIVFCSVGFIYADDYTKKYSKARPDHKNGRSVPISRRFTEAGQATNMHTIDYLYVNDGTTAIPANFDNVSVTEILGINYEGYRHLANDGSAVEASDPEHLKNTNDCLGVINRFFSRCGDCDTYLEIAKYILLYVVYETVEMDIVRTYINYVSQTLEKWNPNVWFDKYSVASPNEFCRSLNQVQRDACSKQMKGFFGPGFDLNTKRTAIKEIFKIFDIRHVRQQLQPAFIEGYILHVKNRFYYDKTKLPNSGEGYYEFCRENYGTISAPGVMQQGESSGN